MRGHCPPDLLRFLCQLLLGSRPLSGCGLVVVAVSLQEAQEGGRLTRLPGGMGGSFGHDVVDVEYFYDEFRGNYEN